MFRRQNSTDQIGLRRGMNFIQMLLGFRPRNKVLDALVESAVNDQIRPRAEGGADAFAVDRRPFSESCRSVEIYLSLFIRHPCRLFLPRVFKLVCAADHGAAGRLSEIGKPIQSGPAIFGWRGLYSRYPTPVRFEPSLLAFESWASDDRCAANECHDGSHPPIGCVQSACREIALISKGNSPG